MPARRLPTSAGLPTTEHLEANPSRVSHKRLDTQATRVQSRKHIRKTAAVAAVVMMILSPMAPVIPSMVGTVDANSNTIGSSVPKRLTVSDPEPGVTTTHAWRDYPVSATSTSQIVIDYQSSSVSDVGVDDVEQAGLDTDADGEIEQSVTVSSVDVQDNGTMAVFNLDAEYNISESNQIVLVYGDVTHPESGGDSASISGSTGSTDWRSGVSLGLSTPQLTYPETYTGTPYPEGLTPQDASPDTNTTYVYRAGPASDGSNVTVDQIRAQLPEGTDISGVSTSTITTAGVDTDGDGEVEESLSVSGVTKTTWASGQELQVAFSSSPTVEPGEDVIVEFGSVTNPSSGNYEVYTKYNDYVGFGSDTLTIKNTYTITGVVTDASGSAVENATVDVDRQWTNRYDVSEVTTDADGSYSVTVPESGNYTVEVSAAGYTSSVQTMDVTGDTTADASLEEANYTYSATVTDANGTALEGATVELVNDSGEVVSSATTGADGTVEVSAPSGTYSVGVAATGYEPVTGTADLQSSGGSGSYSLTASTYTVDGNVTDADGNAVEGATVTLMQDGSTVATATTDADGSYSLSGVEYGSDYTLAVSADGYAAAEQSLSVMGDTTGVDVSLAQTTWTHTVDAPANGTADHVYADFDASGNASISVEAYNNTSGEWEQVDTTTAQVEGNESSLDTVTVGLANYTAEDYTEYRVAVEEVEPASVGIIEDNGGAGGLLPSDDASSPLVIGALVAGGAWLFLRGRS